MKFIRVLQVDLDGKRQARLHWNFGEGVDLRMVWNLTDNEPRKSCSQFRQCSLEWRVGLHRVRLCGLTFEFTGRRRRSGGMMGWVSFHYCCGSHALQVGVFPCGRCEGE